MKKKSCKPSSEPQPAPPPSAPGLTLPSASNAEFRGALRDALENTGNLPVTHGVISMSNQDHTGLDERARVLLGIESDNWKLAK